MASTQRDRDAAKRAEKLADIKDQVDEGRLTIRQMTDEERARYAPRRPASERGPSRKKR